MSFYFIPRDPRPGSRTTNAVFHHEPGILRRSTTPRETHGLSAGNAAHQMFPNVSRVAPGVAGVVRIQGVHHAIGRQHISVVHRFLLAGVRG